MYNYLTILILVLSLMLVSCSDDKESGNRNGVQSGTPGTTGNEAGDEGQDHWIFSVVFQRIKAGSFTMGGPTGESERLGGLEQDDEKQVPVEISKPFEIMEKEVTQKQWFYVKKENPSHFKTSGDCDDHETVEGVEMCPNHPVEDVSWDDAQDYIAKLNDSLGSTGCNGTPQDSSGCYRLPTEAEWEWAVRAETKTAYFFGDDSSDLEDYAWYWENSGGRTHKVGMKSSNPNGLYDVYGNVWEWVQDGYSRELPGGRDPLNTSGSLRVLRGGSWSSVAWLLRSASRSRGYPLYDYSDFGFRLVRTL